VFKLVNKILDSLVTKMLLYLKEDKVVILYDGRFQAAPAAFVNAMTNVILRSSVKQDPSKTSHYGIRTFVKTFHLKSLKNSEKLYLADQRNIQEKIEIKSSVTSKGELMLLVVVLTFICASFGTYCIR
jgi:hypothetical protein